MSVCWCRPRCRLGNCHIEINNEDVRRESMILLFGLYYRRYMIIGFSSWFSYCMSNISRKRIFNLKYKHDSWEWYSATSFWTHFCIVEVGIFFAFLQYGPRRALPSMLTKGQIKQPRSIPQIYCKVVCWPNSERNRETELFMSNFIYDSQSAYIYFIFLLRKALNFRLRQIAW